MRYFILGPLQVRDADRPVDLGGAHKRRLLLAALLAHPDRPVGVDALTAALWNDRPPPSARRNIHLYAHQLRRALGAGAIVASPAGYTIVPRDGVDSADFRRLSAAGGAALRGRDLPRAGELLGQALELWRGPAFAEFSDSGPVNAEAQRLEQLRLTVTEQWAQAQLAGEPSAQLVPELTELVRHHPYHEGLRALLMRALARDGRPAQALELFQRTRALLRDELGVEPGPALRRLHQAILRGDGDHPAPAAAGRPRPAQLSRDIAGFTGRAAALSRLDALLDGSRSEPATVVISGSAGIGKTALAVHWAHRVADRFPDGHLHVNLQGFSDQPVDPGAAVRGFLDALQVPPERIPADPGAQVGLYRSLLAGRRMLVVLDNARDATQVRPLLPGASGCLVLVTSRNQLAGLIAGDGAQPLHLDVLSTAEAHQLLAQRLGPRRLAAEPAATGQLIARCARLPLALSIVAAQATTQPDFPLAALARELGDAPSLDAFTGEDPATDLRAVFACSYRTLDARTARLFRLLGLHPGPDVAVPAAASLAGIPPHQARRLLSGLVHANLLTQHHPGRYTFHDLLRAYAAELAHTIDPDADRHEATHRMLDHYLHSAHTAARMLEPQLAVAVGVPRPGVTPACVAQATTWLTTERANLLAGMRLAAGGGFATHAWQLAWILTTFLQRRGYWQDQLATHQLALAANRRRGNATGQAYAHHGLFRAHFRLGRIAPAHRHAQRMRDLFHSLGDPAGQARAHIALSHVCAAQGQFATALEHTGQALTLFHTASDESGRALALNSHGWNHALLGQYDHALSHCGRALARLERLGDRHGQACALDSLGYAHHHLGDHCRAATCYRQALALFRQAGERYLEAETLTHLGDTQHAAGDPDAARTAWQEALEILDELDHPGAEQVRSRLHRVPPPARIVDCER